MGSAFMGTFFKKAPTQSIYVPNAAVPIQLPVATEYYNDAGNATPNVAVNDTHPAIIGVVGPTQEQAAAYMTDTSGSSSASEFAAAYDPNPTGLLSTFAASAGTAMSNANGNGVAQNAGTNAPLGPQVSYMDAVVPTAGSSGNGGIVLIGFAVVAIAGFFAFKYRKDI